MGHLEVVIPPDIADEDGSEASAPEGGSVELRCTATGEPPPTISWKRTAGRPIVFRDDNGKKYKGKNYGNIYYIEVKQCYLFLRSQPV